MFLRHDVINMIYIFFFRSFEFSLSFLSPGHWDFTIETSFPVAYTIYSFSRINQIEIYHLFFHLTKNIDTRYQTIIYPLTTDGVFFECGEKVTILLEIIDPTYGHSISKKKDFVFSWRYGMSLVRDILFKTLYHSRKSF